MEQDKIKQPAAATAARLSSARISAALRRAWQAAWPICLGYFPLGLAMGVLSRQAGISAWLTGLMSLFLFAGSAQFICVAMLASGASAPAIVFTTFMVNLRHALMSSALALYLQGVNRWFLSLFAYGVTDETFAINMARFRAGDWDRYSALIVNQFANGAWVLSTVVGALVGQLIPQGAYGIDYALIAMFICLLVFQLHNRLMVFTALAAALIAVAWALYIPGNSYIVGASMSAASLAFLVKRRRERRQ